MDRLPPRVCRLLARRKEGGGTARVPLTALEIAEASGLSVERVARLSRLTTFAEVPVAEADAFRLGCGITRENERRHVAYLKRTRMWSDKPLAHLDALSTKQKDQVAALYAPKEDRIAVS